MPKPSLTFEFDAMGTHWWIESLGDKPIDGLFQFAIKSEVQDFEAKYSRFNPDSLISKLNNTGELKDPPRELVDMLKYAHATYLKTDGVFNISVGGELNKLGYGHSKKGSIAEDIWDYISINKNIITIPKTISIDLGGFGKGWIIDRIRQILDISSTPKYIINGGGDIYVNSDQPIKIGLEHPYDNTKIIGSTKITKGALAASSVVKRQWAINDKTVHHIIDPKTNKPANSGIVASFIRADSALIADTLATCLIIRPDLREKLVKKFKIKVILIDKNQLSKAE